LTSLNKTAAGVAPAQRIIDGMYYGERFNGYSHLAGTVMALAAASTLITLGAQRGDPWRITSFAIYGTILFALFLFSTLYHSTRGRAKAVFRKLDHSMIYLMIAGTYTPFTLVTLNGPNGWTLFGVIWGLAILGIVQELWIARGLRLVSLAIYLLMGWAALFAVQPLLAAIAWKGLAWLVAGGVAYTAGVIFYFYDERFRHWHGIWHLCVLAGATLHFAAIVLYVA
jgi:hemolysin III